MATRRLCVRAMHKIAPLRERKMVDKFTIRVKGGHGGSGCTSWRKSRHSRYGVADGGNGGIGGNVYLESKAEVWDFRNLQHLARAQEGGRGAAKEIYGKFGGNKILEVPVGTVVHLAHGVLPKEDDPVQIRKNIKRIDSWQEEEDWLQIDHVFPKDAQQTSDSSSETGSDEHHSDSSDGDDDENSDEDDGTRKIIQHNVAELTKPGMKLLVAKGGKGGRGNTAMPRGFGREKLLPRYEHEPGSPGTEAVLILELKSIADVGLVGPPNVGKSTLLGAISRAKPNVGNYAFTTLRPSVGQVMYEDYFSLTVADIPGLITGAHEDRGLGFAFLRHVERTRVFAYVLDASLNVPPWIQLDELMYEMERYKTGMTKRPSIIVATKIDEAGTGPVIEELKRRVQFPVYPVCAILDEGIDEFREGLRRIIEVDDEFEAKLEMLKSSNE